MEMDQIASDSRRSSGGEEADDEQGGLKWAALEKLPTFDRLRTAFMESYYTEDDDDDHINEKKEKKKQVDVRNLGVDDHRQILDRLFKVPEVDNGRFLRKLRSRFDSLKFEPKEHGK
ncbi:hypothetical protein OSB04_002560 [Centaurea solstitialis]|uniref:Uncharacterized protein n=1 Tax=Centaurea solstitialis TaxID=347529 RepID=A0AA38TTL6_9ASTR|nr:hypothetical protein OSB04_002560 [Centaurea solstitialis]